MYKIKIINFLFIILVIFPVSISFSNNFNEQQILRSKIVVEASSQKDLKNRFTTRYQFLADLLIQKAESYENGGVHWKTILNAPISDLISDQYYPGLYSGAAGIGYFLLNAYKDSKNETYLSYAQKAADYILSQKKYNNGLIYWQRSEYSLSDSYSSLKYGPAGISDYLVALYQETYNQTFLDEAEFAMNSLLLNALKTRDIGLTWSYSFFGNIPLTDMIYGSGGISSSYLNLYKVTKNEMYLETALLAMEWIMNLSYSSNSSIGNLLTIKYSKTAEFPYNYTGYSSGVAGLGDHFLNLYAITGNNSWLMNAINLGHWLITQENDGIWQYGGVSYLTGDTDEAGDFYGVSAGSAGIGLFLLNLYHVTREPLFLDCVNRIYAFLMKYKIDQDGQYSWPMKLTGYNSQIIYTGLSHGVAGIGMFFTKYFDDVGSKESEIIELLDGIDAFFENSSNADGLIPNILNSTRIWYDSSLFDGISGIGMFYLDAKLSFSAEEINKSDYYSNYPFFNSFSFNKPKITTNTDSTSDTTNTTSFGLTYLETFAICLILILYKFRKNKERRNLLF